MVKAERRSDLQETLTPMQERTGQEIINTLQQAGDTRMLIVLEGLSGVGKTTVLDSIASAIALHNAQIVDEDDPGEVRLEFVLTFHFF